MIVLCAIALIVDAALGAYVGARLVRARREGVSLRLRIFLAISAAALVGALLTGLAAIAPDVLSEGAHVVFARIAEKAFLLASVILVIAAAMATALGHLLARSIEEIARLATRLAAGDDASIVPRATEREVRQLARALATMRREIAGQPYAAAFLRDAWHDLKSPVAAIKATIEVLEDGGLVDRVASERLLRNARTSSDRLERTVADLVTLSRYQTSALAPDAPAALASIVDNALATARPLADAKHVELRATGDLLVKMLCDGAAIERAISALVVNGIEASPEGQVTTDVRRHHDQLSIEVINEPGVVAEEIRDRLFDRAVSSRGREGSGLGLAIARAAIEAHGGTVSFIEYGPPRVVVRIELPSR